jgi:hypothetical protein
VNNVFSSLVPRPSVYPYIYMCIYWFFISILVPFGIHISSLYVEPHLQALNQTHTGMTSKLNTYRCLHISSLYVCLSTRACVEQLYACSCMRVHAYSCTSRCMRAAACVTHIEEYEDTYVDPYRERLEQLHACTATSPALYT